MSQQRSVSDIGRAYNIIRSDDNCSYVQDCVEHLSWLLLLRFLDQQVWADVNAADTDVFNFNNVLEPLYRWSEWVPKALGKQAHNGSSNTIFRSEDITEKVLWSGTDLLHFVRKDLLPYLSSLSGSPEKDLIASFFKNRNTVVCASADNLKEALKIIDAIDAEHHDNLHIIADAYEELLRIGGENRGIDGFYTPRSVIQLMVNIIHPRAGEAVYDPCCGSGAFLTEALEYLMRERPKKTDQYSGHAQADQQSLLLGQAKNALSALFSRVTMLLHNASATTIIQGNALEEDVAKDFRKKDVISNVEGFDIIIANPPFGGKVDKHIQENFPIKSDNTELLYLQHIMENLKAVEGARCGVVVSEGTLFQQGAAAAVREKLLRDFNLFMVLSLPLGAFAPYSDVKTSLIFFKWPGPTAEVLYYEMPLPASLRRFSKINPINETHFAEALDVWSHWKLYLDERASRPDLPQTSWVETIDTLAWRGYNLVAKNPNSSK